ncbi:MAG: hypothetical protein ACLFV5_09015 [Anaerolineales bacterium]
MNPLDFRIMPERADYEYIAERYPWAYKKGSPMIISLDLDGIISAMLMATLLDWRLVGFYNASKLWVEGDIDWLAGEAVFLDHDIYRANIPSIGHHILQWRGDVPTPLHQESLNPNLLRGISKQNTFSQKYPFGTVHFLLACLNAHYESEVLELPRDFMPILIQVDSSFQSAFTYQRNALEWMEWLGGSDEQSPLYPLCHSLMSTSPRRLLEWTLWYDDEMRNLGFGSKRRYSSRRRQGQVDSPVGEGWKILQVLIDWLYQRSPWFMVTPDFEQLRATGNLEIVELKRGSMRPTKGRFENLMKKRPFSYAIISSSDEGLNYAFLPQSSLRAMRQNPEE